VRDLPTGWAMAHLNEVAEVRLGRQRSPKNHSGTRMRPYLRAGNVTWSGLDLSDVKTMNFTMDESEVYELHAGDVLVSEASGSASEVGKPAMWRDEIPNCCFQNTLLRVRSYGPLPEYLMYVLRTDALIGRLGDAARGVGIHHIGAQRLSSWMIPVAPLAEQRRIVAVIEEQLSRLDAAEVWLRRAKVRLNQMRGAVYSYEVAADWPLVALKSLLREPLRNGHSATASRDGKGVRTLTLTAVTRDDFSEVHTKLTTADRARVRNLWLEPGDLLIERSNTPELVGTAALFRGKRAWAIFPDLLIRVRVSECVLPEFLALVLKAEPARRYFRQAAQGIAGSMPKIDQGAVERLPVPLPSLDAQRTLVAKVERQLSLVAAVSAEVEVALRRSAALRRSILKRAFTGTLVPQDVADEPASALLERIVATRSVTTKSPRSRQRRVPA
jgi:type I restriction enzyme S subunit